MNAGHAGRGARYRPNRKRRASTAVLTALAAAIAATLFVALGARAVMARISCTHNPLVVHVAVSTEIEPVATRLGALFNRERHIEGGRCAQVAVQAEAPAAVASAFATGHQGPGRTQVGAWIPDSQLWADLARSTQAGAGRVHPTGTVLAQTPLMIVMPRQAAALTPAFGATVGWRFLFPENLGGPAFALGLNVQFPDPTKSAIGLAVLNQVRTMLPGGRPGRFDLARFAFNVQVVAPPADGAVLPALETLAKPAPKGSTPTPTATVTTEQAVIQYDRSHPLPLAARYPDGGTLALRFPYLITAPDPLTARAAKAFGGLLRSPYAAALARYEGFRTPAGKASPWPAAYGLQGTQPRLLPQPGPTRAAAALYAWRRMVLGERLLALNDISSSMAATVAPGGPTLEKLLGGAAALGMQRFPDSTQMGLWVFASHLRGDQPYRELVPLGPLPAPFGLVSRRQAIEHYAGSSRTVPTGAALYSSILAAYKEATATYQPQYVNGVIVLTAGVENAKDDISQQSLIRQLSQLYNPQQPINITLIMIGQAGDFAAMQKIVAPTNGKVFDITDPTQIRTVFYRAMARLICRPHCPK